MIGKKGEKITEVIDRHLQPFGWSRLGLLVKRSGDRNLIVGEVIQRQIEGVAPAEWIAVVGGLGEINGDREIGLGSFGLVENEVGKGTKIVDLLGNKTGFG